ncbi:MULTISPECIES: DUF4956 domain-containing protein [Trichococcus]|jgi:uncharacterized membrane protein YhiD involved in acid resistance|uniref:DUF4956 domain-containing protein n=2 Tax=Trichococcus shcherbakoviae TaxID=2094020 RepID=A0A383TIB0_9LACT|nr:MULTISPECIES: DUF4956 domain-containing protein [Trichococcus]MDB6353172.1 DUF4956 domain-containing protein [Trichococcus sp. K1Tr]TNV69993.1 DUF4956 domain-containing protein [Trichococcus shcherbakoviae subsp. psychrophilus]SYZ79607.1 Hypothetical protein TART1_2480 [Trichococcus shcherbakoviae]HEX5350861.1 DUF4956 domain-containing protein [Trichococcus sp.]
MTTFTDIIKNSFLEETADFSIAAASVSLLSALFIGLFIFFIYKKTYAGVMYSKPFNTSLVLLSVLTTFVILAVTSNVVLSLGMVGALSIVRFRTAIKEPLDLVFLFWSISVGIILGAGLYSLAFLGSAFITVILLVLTGKVDSSAPYILMLQLENENAELQATEIIKNRFGKIIVKSKSITDGQPELIYEVKVKNNETSFMNELSAIEGVQNATLVSYNGNQAG